MKTNKRKAMMETVNTMISEIKSLDLKHTRGNGYGVAAQYAARAIDALEKLSVSLNACDDLEVE